GENMDARRLKCSGIENCKGATTCSFQPLTQVFHTSSICVFLFIPLIKTILAYNSIFGKKLLQIRYWPPENTHLLLKPDPGQCPQGDRPQVHEPLNQTQT